MSNNNKGESGDGLALHNAIKLSEKNLEEIIKDMEISNGTIYRYFKRDVLEDDIKQAAAKALGRSVEDIFNTRHIPPPEDPTPTKKRIPVIGDAMAGNEMEINVTESDKVGDYVDVGDLLSDSEAAFTVYGNSMNPNYPAGCLMGLKRNYDNFIQPGEIYMLLTKSNRVFKRLYLSEDGEKFICYSDNTMKYESGPREGMFFYPPFEVHKSDVISIFDITGMIKRLRNSAVMNRH